jgi:hypothetical protein
VAAVASTTGQSGLAGTTLPRPLTVQVAADGTPVAGMTVVWKPLAGTLGRTTSVTGADGLTTSAWTLGVDTGVQTATATVAEAQGSPVTFSARALALPPEPPPVEPPAPPPQVPTGVAEVFVRPMTQQARPGKSYQLTAIPLDVYGYVRPDAAVSWKSQHPGIATVSASGLLTGVAPGSTTISATSEGVVGTVAITVLGTIVSVQVIATRAAIAVGEEAFWRVDARDVGGTRMELVEAIWQSEDPGIALAGPHGRILGVHLGTGQIAATVEGVTGKARVTVIAPLNLSGDWSMDEQFGEETFTSCAASGPVVLNQGNVSASIGGTYHRTGICSQLRGGDSLGLTGAVPLHGSIAGNSVNLESSTIYQCDYRGLVSGGAPNRVEGSVTCRGLPGTPQSEYYGRFTLTK